MNQLMSGASAPRSSRVLAERTRRLFVGGSELPCPPLRSVDATSWEGSQPRHVLCVKDVLETEVSFAPLNALPM